MTPKEAKEALTKSIYQKLRKDGVPKRYIFFVAEYMTNGMNATQAYVDTIARKNLSERSRAHCGVDACEILRKPIIADAVRELFDYWLNEKKTKLEKEIIAVLYARAFYDPTMFLNADGSSKIENADKIPEKWRPAIDGIETKYYGRDGDRKVVVWKLANRSHALTELSKYIKLYQDTLGLKVDMGEETINKLKDIFDGKK